MATKKQNRQIDKRKQRRVLNRVMDFFTRVSGHRLNLHRCNSNINRVSVRDSSRKEG
jgi:hypothetical protein